MRVGLRSTGVLLTRECLSSVRLWRTPPPIPWIPTVRQRTCPSSTPPSFPKSRQSAKADSVVLSSIISRMDQLVIISQTCDIMRDCRQLPFLSLAPVVKLTEPIAGEARKGHRPRFIPIPGLGDECFANLDNVITAEKSVLLGLKPKRGLPDDNTDSETVWPEFSDASPFPMTCTILFENGRPYQEEARTQLTRRPRP